MTIPTASEEDKAFRAFLTGFGTTLVTSLSLLILLSVLVDPYGAWGTGIFPLGHEGSVTRLGKAELLARYQGSIALVGNSRTRIGVNPMSAALPVRPACNLGVSGASWREVNVIIERVLEKPSIRTVLLFVDYPMFSDASPGKGAFNQSRFNPSLSETSYRFQLLFNSESVKDSFETLGSWIARQPPTHTSLGFSIPESPSDRKSKETSHQQVEDILRQLADRCIATKRGIDDAQFAILRKTLQLAADKDKRVIIVVNPMHATYLESLWLSGAGPHYEEWLRELTEHVNGIDGDIALWNFSGWYLQSCSPFFKAGPNGSICGYNPWYREPSHFRANLGDEILRRVFNSPHADPDFGTVLTSDTIESEIQSIAARRRRWLQAAPSDANYVLAMREQRYAASALPPAAEAADGGSTHKRAKTGGPRLR